MLKTAFFTFFLIHAFPSLCQDIYVRVYGRILSQKDSSAVSASIRYEKLPYFDDIGMVRSNADGSYEFYLVKGLRYRLQLAKEGFQTKTEELEIPDPSGDQTYRKDFFIVPEEEPELITLENLIFARGSDRISESSHQGLNELWTWLEERPNVIIQLEGHTDFAGNADANMRLSQARVEAVKKYLVDLGIRKNRVMTKAFGGSQPLTNERTDEAKAKNRRVEVRIIRK